MVRDLLASWTLSPSHIVLDPMNGSGTTTVVAQSVGVSSVGADLSPVMVSLARAKSLSVHRKIKKVGLAVLRNRIAKALDRHQSDLFAAQITQTSRQWMPPLVYGSLRALFLNSGDDAIGSVLKAVAISAVRKLVPLQSGSNPTWIKPPDKHPTGVQFDKVVETCITIAEGFAIDLDVTFGGATGHPKMSVIQASAKHLPLLSQSIDAIVTSPPYLTRLDYVRATLPELLIACKEPEREIEHLRATMMGGIAVKHVRQEDTAFWSATANSVLRKILAHPSKASTGYYYKFFYQYFVDAQAIVREWCRLVKRRGRIAIVVQDTWYKDIHVPLPQIFQELFRSLKLETEHRKDICVTRHMSLLNPAAQGYAKGAVTESVIVFRKQ
jgi:SAM-dependent methyltransferase